MINPMQLLQMLANGGNPMQTLTGMARSDPQLGQVLSMVNGRTPAQLQQLVYDTARQRGVDVNVLAKQLGIRLPR